MKTQHYNKLVRDKIPEIIVAAGQRPTWQPLSDADYFIALKQKLQEEVTEFNNDQTVEELADILEVILTLSSLLGANAAKLEKLRLNKREQRGGFDQQIFLSKVERI